MFHIFHVNGSLIGQKHRSLIAKDHIMLLFPGKAVAGEGKKRPVIIQAGIVHTLCHEAQFASGLPQDQHRLLGLGVKPCQMDTVLHGPGVLDRDEKLPLAIRP